MNVHFSSALIFIGHFAGTQCIATLAIIQGTMPDASPSMRDNACNVRKIALVDIDIPARHTTHLVLDYRIVLALVAMRQIGIATLAVALTAVMFKDEISPAGAAIMWALTVAIWFPYDIFRAVTPMHIADGARQSFIVL